MPKTREQFVEEKKGYHHESCSKTEQSVPIQAMVDLVVIRIAEIYRFELGEETTASERISIRRWIGRLSNSKA